MLGLICKWRVEKVLRELNLELCSCWKSYVALDAAKAEDERTTFIHGKIAAYNEAIRKLRELV